MHRSRHHWDRGRERDRRPRSRSRERERRNIIRRSRSKERDRDKDNWRRNRDTQDRDKGRKEGGSGGFIRDNRKRGRSPSPSLRHPKRFESGSRRRSSPSSALTPSRKGGRHSISVTEEEVRKKDEEVKNGEGSDDEEDEVQVEKWVRSAPAEVYYRRGESGSYIATEMTKKLCSRFDTKLLLKAQQARLEAERLGEEKMEELAVQEQNEIRMRKEQKKGMKECTHNHNHDVECSKHAHGSCGGHGDEHVDKTANNGEKHDSSGTSHKEPCANHEEGEICDCQEEVNRAGGDKVKGVDTVDRNTKDEPDNVSIVSRIKGICNNLCSKDHNHNGESSDNTNLKGSDKNVGTSGSSDGSSESDSGSSSSDESSDEDEVYSRSSAATRELEKRKQHPRRLHQELWHNDPGLMNDGPVCRCSAKARRFGIRHGYYPGEMPIPICDPFSNNIGKLVHYRITISPPKNFLVKTPTVIRHDNHEYIFEGFSLFSHHKIDLSLPPCRVIRFNIRYEVFVAEEKFPESFCVKELDLFEKYLFREILELLDLKFDWNEQGSCSPFHFMPRFVRQLPDNGKEILSMNRVLLHLLENDKDLFKPESLPGFYRMSQSEWQNFADKHKGRIVTTLGMKPAAIRVDQIDRDASESEVDGKKGEGPEYPMIVHFGIRPPQLSYAGNANYQRAWRQYVKFRHLLSNMPKPKPQDKRALAEKEMKLQQMRTASSMKRDVTIAVLSKGFRTTGIFCDLVQHAMVVPVLVSHLRFHEALNTLEINMDYKFSNRSLLQLAMTHPSYRENFGTNPDHARNALTNCGIRQPEYGDRRIHYASTRKRGITTLINIMAKFGSDQERESGITHNERLEFLGDAVVEFISSIHLFHLFPELEEGGLATYRAAIVQNQHLAELAKSLKLDQFMLYAHGSDLCHDSELRHAMANCFEALMGALFLDGGIETADRVLAKTLFRDDEILHNIWVHYPRHPLQQEEPNGDRHWVASHSKLQSIAEFEESIGVTFTHIRLLARAFTDRSLGYNNLSKGSNQRLEFLGDTVLQLITSTYLYRHFPDHHEGHLSLLRSSLVNNRTQAVVSDDLGLSLYALRGEPKAEMKMKDRADLLEAVLGALYIDKGLKYCIIFCSQCFFPRLNASITKQEWNDPKSKLQQCCLTLRNMNGKEPEIPVYKVTESLGPTNTRVYTVAVYFRGERLATAKGHSIQEAEMNAAGKALEDSGCQFPQLHHQKSVVEKYRKRLKPHRSRK